MLRVEVRRELSMSNLRFTSLDGNIGLHFSGDATFSSSVTYSKLIINIIATPSWFFTGIMWVLQMKVDPAYGEKKKKKEMHKWKET